MIVHKVLILALVHSLAVALPPNEGGGGEGCNSCMKDLADAVKEIAQAMSKPPEYETCTKPFENTDTSTTNYNPNADYAVGDTVTVTCKKGYKPSNPQTATCLHNDEWSTVKECKPACPDGYQSQGSLCYDVFPTMMSFYDAVIHCAEKNPELGSRLLIPNTAAKQKDIMDLVRTSGFFSQTMKSLWIGTSDRFKERRFFWNDGSVMRRLYQQFRFMPGEPNDGGGAEDCIHLRGPGLNDIHCDSTNWAAPICEIPIM